MSKHIVTGGKSVYGASVGILMLEADFPRIYGEIGNAETWPFPVHYKVVKGASPDRVVLNRGEGLNQAFIEAAKELVEIGVDGITTNCGFLALIQEELSQACKIPVATSSLMQYSFIRRLLPKSKSVGIITVSAKTLSHEHLNAAGIPLDTTIVGTDEVGTELSRVILNNETRLNVQAAEQDMVNAAKALLERDPSVGAILLECTNMSPYSSTLQQVTGLPVFDMYNYICWFQKGLAPQNFLDRYL